MIIIRPTKIKDSFYMLIPSKIAEFIGIKDKTEFRLEIENKDKIIVKYIENKKKAKRGVDLIKDYVTKQRRTRRTKKTKRRKRK